MEDGELVSIGRETLIGSSWTLRSGAGPEGEIALIDGWPITLIFDEETLGGTAACNGCRSLAGSYIVAGNEIHFTTSPLRVIVLRPCSTRTVRS